MVYTVGYSTLILGSLSVIFAGVPCCLVIASTHRKRVLSCMARAQIIKTNAGPTQMFSSEIHFTR